MCVVVEPIWAAPDEQSYSSGGQPPKLEGIPSAYIADIDFTHAVKEVSELAVMQYFILITMVTEYYLYFSAAKQ